MSRAQYSWLVLGVFLFASVVCVAAIVLYALVPPVIIHPTLGPLCDETCVKFRTTVVPRVSPDQVYLAYAVWVGCLAGLLGSMGGAGAASGSEAA
jgi:hypothetical protein